MIAFLLCGSKKTVQKWQTVKKYGLFKSNQVEEFTLNIWKQTNLKLEKNKKLYRGFLKKAIVLATNKLKKFKEDSVIITRVIAETIVKIFELPLEALTGNIF